jgi:hypothetical protein
MITLSVIPVSIALSLVAHFSGNSPVRTHRAFSYST